MQKRANGVPPNTPFQSDPPGSGQFCGSFLCFHIVPVYRVFPHGGRLNGTAFGG
jgi:hypothetical protein